jgi:hypothetical protein
MPGALAMRLMGVMRELSGAMVRFMRVCANLHTPASTEGRLLCDQVLTNTYKDFRRQMRRTQLSQVKQLQQHVANLTGKASVMFINAKVGRSL